MLLFIALADFCDVNISIVVYFTQQDDPTQCGGRKRCTSSQPSIIFAACSFNSYIYIIKSINISKM